MKSSLEAGRLEGSSPLFLWAAYQLFTDSVAKDYRWLHFHVGTNTYPKAGLALYCC
jgi:hypothetical protein